MIRSYLKIFFKCVLSMLPIFLIFLVCSSFGGFKYLEKEKDFEKIISGQYRGVGFRRRSKVKDFSISAVVIPENENLCAILIPAHIKSIRESIISAWTVLDLMRSMQINEGDKIQFSLNMLDDIVSILTGLSNLSVCTNFCAAYYESQKEEIKKLRELLASFLEVFEGIFKLPNKLEESALYKILGVCIDVIIRFKD